MIRLFAPACCVIASLGCGGPVVVSAPADAAKAPVRIQQTVPVEGGGKTRAGRTAEVTSHRLGVIGELEVVRFAEFGGPYVARIDTGANTSSVHAAGVEPFTRDGEDWVAFDILGRDGAPPIRLERKVTRSVAIKKAAGTVDERYVVDLAVRFGGETLEREFTLADRSGMNYAVLIGRNVLDGTAVVDVSRAYLLEPPPSASGDPS